MLKSRFKYWTTGLMLLLHLWQASCKTRLAPSFAAGSPVGCDHWSTEGPPLRIATRRQLRKGPGSWEGLGDENGQCLRLQKGSLPHMGCTNLTRERQTEIAKCILQWAPPETLETGRYLSDLPSLVVISLKPKGKICLINDRRGYSDTYKRSRVTRLEC